MAKMRRDDSARGGKRNDEARARGGPDRRGGERTGQRPTPARASPGRGAARASDREHNRGRPAARSSDRERDGRNRPAARASDRGGSRRGAGARGGPSERRAGRSSVRRAVDGEAVDDYEEEEGGFHPGPGMIIGMASGGGILLIICLSLLFGGDDDHRPPPVPGAGAGVEEGWHSTGGQEAAPVVADDLRSADLIARIERAEGRLEEVLAFKRAHPTAYRDIYHKLEMAQRVAHETEVAPRCRALADQIRARWDEVAQAELAAVEERASRLEAAGDKAEAYALYRDFDPQLLPRVEAEVDRHRRRLHGSVKAHATAVTEAKGAIVDLLMAGKAAAARQASRELMAEDEASADWARAGEGAALALDRYERTMRRHLESKVGDAVTVATADGEISGEMGHADESCIRITTDDGLIKIPWHDLTRTARTALRRGGWQPTSSHDLIVVALRALRDQDPEVATTALKEAGDHALAADLRQRIER